MEDQSVSSASIVGGEYCGGDVHGNQCARELVKNPWGAEGWVCSQCQTHFRGQAHTCFRCETAICKQCWVQCQQASTSIFTNDSGEALATTRTTDLISDGKSTSQINKYYNSQAMNSKGTSVTDNDTLEESPAILRRTLTARTTSETPATVHLGNIDQSFLSSNSSSRTLHTVTLNEDEESPSDDNVDFAVLAFGGHLTNRKPSGSQSARAPLSSPQFEINHPSLQSAVTIPMTARNFTSSSICDSARISASNSPRRGPSFTSIKPISQKTDSGSFKSSRSDASILHEQAQAGSPSAHANASCSSRSVQVRSFSPEFTKTNIYEREEHQVQQSAYRELPRPPKEQLETSRRILQEGVTWTHGEAWNEEKKHADNGMEQVPLRVNIDSSLRELMGSKEYKKEAFPLQATSELEQSLADFVDLIENEHEGSYVVSRAEAQAAWKQVVVARRKTQSGRRDKILDAMLTVAEYKLNAERTARRKVERELKLAREQLTKALTIG